MFRISFLNFKFRLRIFNYPTVSVDLVFTYCFFPLEVYSYSRLTFKLKHFILNSIISWNFYHYCYFRKFFINRKYITLN